MTSISREDPRVQAYQQELYNVCMQKGSKLGKTILNNPSLCVVKDEPDTPPITKYMGYWCENADVLLDNNASREKIVEEGVNGIGRQTDSLIVDALSSPAL
ncbi:MAG: hypothetical protein HAW67_00625, partial [Endozoicomonadaceae bacterium]|nr:hypothetical protein [Endozoicomonadaceae bacterium]